MDLLFKNTYDFSWVVQQVGPGGATTPYDLTGRDLTVVFEQNGVRRLQIPSPDVNGNVVTFSWQGKDQHAAGPFRILLIENDGQDDMRTIDSLEPFRLVKSSAEIRDRRAPSGAVSVTTIDLLSLISVYPDQAIPATIARQAWVRETFYTKAQADTLLGDKVDKVTGKGLSEANFTQAEKDKLAEVASGSQVNVIEGVQRNGTDLAPDLNKKVNIVVPTALSDLSDDSTHRLVTDSQKETWNGKYTKPASGIPSSDLAEAVRTAIAAAGTALQPADITTLSNKVASLESLISEGDSPTAAIDKFNEIVAFLASITNTETLSGIVSGINDAIAAKYTKPDTGIPASDLATAVQSALEKANTALQAHQDISGLASKAPNPTAGNLAELDANGNPVDSGIDADDVAKASELESGSLVPALAGNLDSWKGRASDAPDTQTDEVYTTGGNVSIDSSVDAQLVSVVARQDFAASSLISHGFNLLRRAVAIGTGWYFKVPALPFGVFRTALAPNGVLFTDSEHNNIKPTVRFKPLGSGVPTSINDGSACTYTDAEGYRFFTTPQAGYIIVSGIARTSVCAHIAWSGRYDDYVAVDDESDAGSVISLDAVLTAIHGTGIMLAVGNVADSFARISATQVRWTRKVDMALPTWATVQNEEGTYTHTATIASMAPDGAAEFFTSGTRLSVSGTTVSYTDENEQASSDHVKFELATVATGTVNLATTLAVEDFSIITLEGVSGSAYVTISYARGIPDSLRALIAGDLDGTYSALAGLLVELHERISAIEEKIISGFENIIVDDLTIRHKLDDYSTEGNANLQAAGAPDFIAAKIGQRIFDSVNKVFRTACGFTVADWKIDTNS